MLRNPRRPALIVCLAGIVLIQGCNRSEGDPRIAGVIQKQVAAPFRWFRKATVDDDDVQPLVRRFYEARRHRPAWTHMDGPTADARELIREIGEVPDHGLRRADYDLRKLDSLMKRVAPLTNPDPASLATLDVELTRNFLKLATHRYGGQVNPLQLPADWHIVPRRTDVVALLEDAVDRHRISGTLARLDPGSPQYARLRTGLEQYRRIESDGGWPMLPKGPALRLGATGPRVEALQRRLALTGDLGGFSGGRFDGTTVAGVRRFQQRHGLDPDGVVDAEDLAELNLPVADRIRQIEMNLERRRWVPDSLVRGRYLEVNIPEFALRVIEDDRAVLAMRVVVGKTFSPTPMFNDEISYLVLNPYWNVPPKIASNEILAELQKSPDYLERNNMKMFENAGDGAAEVDARHVDWRDVEPHDFKFAERQEPGPQNAVGHVKFMCPNQFDVYLHDTPAQRLFSVRERDFSHGCIRVERPLDLAVYLLRDKGWDRNRIVEAFDTSHNSTVNLPEPLPVHIVYWTAIADEQGTVSFRNDIYGLDRVLDRALRSRRPDISTPPPTTRASGPSPLRARRQQQGG